MFDFDKVSLERAFPFLASVLPGFALFYEFEAAHPGTVLWFFSFSFLGYRTELSLFLIASFVVGYSLNKFLAASLGAIGGAWGAKMGLTAFDRHPYELPIAPWRDKRWRSAYGKRFGEDLPEDLPLMPRQLADHWIQEASGLKSEDPLSQSLRTYVQGMIQQAQVAVENDKEWRSRYLKLHFEEITRSGREFADQIGAGLDSNLTISSLVIIAGWLIVPQGRLAWLLLLASAWFVLSLLVTLYKLIRFMDPWSTLQAQIDSLNSSGTGS